MTAPLFLTAGTGVDLGRVLVLYVAALHADNEPILTQIRSHATSGTPNRKTNNRLGVRPPSVGTGSTPYNPHGANSFGELGNNFNLRFSCPQGSVAPVLHSVSPRTNRT
jgi:hypothetical protein